MAKGGRCLRLTRTARYARCERRNVLGIIRERGRRGLPLEDVYRHLFNRELYLLAYGQISRNAVR